MKRRIGFPAVHAEADWKAPFRYGDAMRIEVIVRRVGTSACTFRYRFLRASDGVEAAVIEHVTVSTNLDTMTKVPLPADCRALLEAHAG
jgi:acyl-CoA thioesterase FadM